MPEFQRTLEELREHAVLHWPEAVFERAALVSVLPILLETQNQFWLC
jgi:hypothetical protein